MERISRSSTGHTLRRLRAKLSRFLRRRDQRGVAIIMVMAVLAGLIALAAPFAFSMILHGRSARTTLNAEKARAGAEAAISRGLSHLHRLVKAPGYDPTPLTDTIDELKVPPLLSRVTLNINNPQGIMWSTKIEDEQGKINLHSAPPSLIGNLLGSSILEESVERDAAELIVDSAEPFYTDGDPNTIDGFVSLGGQTSPYNHIVGNRIFLAPGGNHRIRRAIRRGALVYDGRAKWISEYSEGGRRGKFRPFRSIHEVKSINERNRNLLAFRPDEFIAIERFITIHSKMGGPEWGRGEPAVDAGNRQVWVENGEGFGPGAPVRLVRGGRARDYDVVESVHPSMRGGKHGWVVRLVKGFSIRSSRNDKNRDYIEPRHRNPVNINTAPLEVVMACVMGIAPYASNEAVSRQQAIQLAHFLTQPGRVYRDELDLKAALSQAMQKGLLSSKLRDAVYINATEPASPKLRTSTVPFCYRSFGSFTIEGTGIINARNGLQLARHTLRQTVTLPSPPPSFFEYKTQKDFQQLVEQGMAARTVTWPVAMGPNSIRHRTTTYIKEPDPNRGDIRLDVGEVGSHGGTSRRGGRRGRGGQGVLHEWIDHCDDPLSKAFFQEGYDMTSRGAYTLPAVAGTNNYMPTGAAELWFKPVGGGQGFIFDSGEETDRNRISFIYEPGRGLVIRIFDANLEGKSAEYVYPCTLNAGRWYHIAGSWRSTHHNGQEARVDGQLIPKDGGEITFKPGSKLAADIDDEDIDTLEVEDAEDFPDKGQVRVGEEVIEYGAKGGGALTQLRRGTCLSAGAAHKEGEFVMPYGYTCRFGETLTTGGALLAEQIEKANGKKTITTRVNHPATTTKPHYVLDSETAKLPVEDATDFPPSGYVLVRGELIYYSSRSATELRGLQRAQSASGVSGAARNLFHRNTVALVSFEVTETGDYNNRPGRDDQFVQVDNEDDENLVEWIQYGDIKSIDSKDYFIGRLHFPSGRPGTYWTGEGERQPNGRWTNGAANFQTRGIGLANFRGVKGTGAKQTHSKKAKVIPVTRMHNSEGPKIGDQWAPRGEEASAVSVITIGQTDGDVRWIKRSHVAQHAHRNRHGQIVNWYFRTYMGLNDFVSRQYLTGNGRILKFPSGDLPNISTPKRTIGAAMDSGGQLFGFADEFKVLALSSRGGKIAMGTSGNGISSGDTQVNVELTEAWPSPSGGNFDPGWPSSGVIRIGEELIAFASSSSNSVSYFSDLRQYIQDKEGKRGKASRGPPPNRESKTVVRLSGLKRGILGSTASDHPPGAGVMLYDAAPITMLRGTLGATSDRFSVLDGKGFPPEGYAWINDEVVSWSQGGGTSFSGCGPFRGRFGTSPANHPSGSVVQALPFRYWDRYAREYDGEGLAYMQAGYSAKDAIWDTVELETKGGSGDPLPNYIHPRILVRFNGKPVWHSKPTNQEGGIYEFFGSGVHGIKGLDRSGGVRANQIEIRVYWQYTKGAFQPNEDWKRTFALDVLRATYHSPMDVMRLEQVERR